jgi:negative regulator of sigma E activity
MRTMSKNPPIVASRVVTRTLQTGIALMMLLTAACVLVAHATRAQAADLFPQKSLNASQQAKVARAVSQTRQLRSDGYSKSIENNARGQVNTGDSKTRSNDRSCNNNAANIDVAKGHRGKIDNTTVVKGDVIMVCRTR